MFRLLGAALAAPSVGTGPARAWRVVVLGIVTGLCASALFNADVARAQGASGTNRLSWLSATADACRAHQGLYESALKKKYKSEAEKQKALDAAQKPFREMLTERMFEKFEATVVAVSQKSFDDDGEPVVAWDFIADVDGVKLKADPEYMRSNSGVGSAKILPQMKVFKPGDCAELSGVVKPAHMSMNATCEFPEITFAPEAIRFCGRARPEGESRGSLEKEQIVSVVREHETAIQSCYDRAEESYPGISGKVIVWFWIAPDGGVREAVVRESSLENDKAEQCIVKEVASWKFPEPVGGSVQMTYPWMFKKKR